MSLPNPFVTLSRRWDLLVPLASGDFVRLLLANGLWWQAMWMEMLITGWLALEITDSAWWVAVLGFYRSIPLLVIGLFSAAITDRYRRRSLMVVLQGLNALGLGLLALLWWLEWLQYWQIAAVALANGAGWALDWPTRRAIVPDLVGKGRVVDGMMLESFIQSLTRIGGPLLAGSLLELVGMLGALVLLAALGGAGLLILLGMKSQSRAPAAAAGIRNQVQQAVEGWRYVRLQPRIFGVMLITLFMNVWAFPYMNLLPVFARDVLGQGPMGLGWLGAANGAGVLLVLLLVNRGRRFWSHEWLFAGGALLFCTGLVAFAFSTSLPWSLALMVFGGLGHAGFGIMQSSIILVEASDQMRGRAMGALVLAIGTGPFGRLQSGAMAELWGAPLAVGLMAAAAGLATLGVGVLLEGFIRPRAAERPVEGEIVEAPARGE